MIAEFAKEAARNWIASRLRLLALHPKGIVVGVKVLREGEQIGTHHIIATVNGEQVLKMTSGKIVKRALTLKIGDGAMISINF